MIEQDVSDISNEPVKKNSEKSSIKYNFFCATCKDYTLCKIVLFNGKATATCTVCKSKFEVNKQKNKPESIQSIGN